MSQFLPTRITWPFVLIIAIISIILVASAASIIIHAIQTSHSRKSEDVSYANDPDIATVYNMEKDFHGETALRYMHTYKTLNRVAIIAVIISVITGAVLISRPSTINPESTQSSSRDIILCLDVSGSALAYDRQIIAAYSELTEHLHGERIGLSIFNSTSKTLFPLTDDYNVITNQLNYAFTLLSRVQTQKSIDAMSDKEYQEVNDWLEGTQNIENSTSLIGDGLVSCTMMLPQLKSSAARKARSASIILATDNVPSGKQTFTLEEALKIAHSSQINVDALYVGTDKTSHDDNAVEMKKAIETYGGTYVDLSSQDTVDDIVRDITSTKSGTQLHDDTSNLIDAPGLVLALSVIAFLAFVLTARRLRR